MEGKIYSRVLMVALFATGLSGIVAEYLLATLATYFLGNSVMQWTLILSFMLFSMGVGSRLSKFFDSALIEKFIVIEFLLSLLVSLCIIITYASMVLKSSALALTKSYGIIIYSQAIVIGLLIGMEIPLVTRINSVYKELRLNIAGVMEKDYYGSLLGGLFFAFIGLPFLGLTYTPFILGGINFIVAFLVLFTFRRLINKTPMIALYATSAFIVFLLTISAFYAERIIKFGEESRFSDKIIYSEETPYQKITLTEYHGDYWLYLDTHTQLSSFDEWLYHEPLVHPVMGLAPFPKDVLILGGGDGCALREVLKYSVVDSVTLVDIDPAMTNLGKSHPVLREINEDAFYDSRVNVVNQDAFLYLEREKQYFDVIIIDFPDPRSIELNRLYTIEFYKLCYRRLRPHGVLITQAGSPYITWAAFKSIEKTAKYAGFNVLPIRNHVYSFGEWGWIIGSKSIESEKMKEMIHHIVLDSIETKWLTKDALCLLTAFGKEFLAHDTIEVNSIHNPVTYLYYEKDIKTAY